MPTAREQQIARALATEGMEQIEQVEGPSERDEQIEAYSEPCGSTTFSFELIGDGKVKTTCAVCGMEYMNSAPAVCGATYLDRAVLR